MSDVHSACERQQRSADVRKSALVGIDYVEIGAVQTTLQVFFLGKAPPGLHAGNVAISGGQPVAVTSVRVNRQRDATLDDWMEVGLDRAGDFSTYTLALIGLDEAGHPTGEPLSGCDPRRSSACFSFKASCPSDQDCRGEHNCPPAQPAPVEISYLAKDYDSFRQLILDRLAQLMPARRETHVPDLGLTLVELLAYVGDQLSYYQDAVATEAYLGTARQRISLRRHARLVDYTVHEGCNARAWLTIATDRDTTLLPGAALFCTPFPGVAAGSTLQMADFAKAAHGSCEVFEQLLPDPAQPLALHAAHNEIRFYTWGDCACCLPCGTTSATLFDTWIDGNGGRIRALSLQAGDVLMFEEVIGPHTGNAADADPAHRQAVRLTRVNATVDPLYQGDSGGQPLLQIEWCPEDALAFPLCLSAVMPAPDCSCREGISVARGNVILVDSGIWVDEALGSVPTRSSSAACPGDCNPPSLTLSAAPFHPVLQQRPLGFSQPLPACGCASSATLQDPRLALPQIGLVGTLPGAGDAQAGINWTPRANLLESGPNDAAFVVEVDDAGAAHLRFGNGDEGQRPDAGSAFQARYRCGNGPDGNVGAEAISCLVYRQTTGDAAKLTPRNPLPATGGTAPEATTDVRMFAPHAFRDVPLRAITACDYADLAADNARRLTERPQLMAPPAPPSLPVAAASRDPRASRDELPQAVRTLPPDLCLIPFRRLQSAKGSLRWTGSWYQVQVAVDPLGNESADAELLAEIDAYLEPYRRIGHDLAVAGARYVPLDLGLSVCVRPGYLRGPVETALRRLLGNGVLPDGSLALFNPDALSFGQGLYLSRIVAAAQAISGVMEVRVTRLARYVLGSPAPTAKADRVPADGLLPLGAFEIARLGNDPSAPGNGRLTLMLRGGR